MPDNEPTGFLRIADVLQRIPISKSAWWRGIQEGRYPRGSKLSVRTTAWKIRDIDELEELLAAGLDWRNHSEKQKAA